MDCVRRNQGSFLGRSAIQALAVRLVGRCTFGKGKLFGSQRVLQKLDKLFAMEFRT